MSDVVVNRIVNRVMLLLELPACVRVEKLLTLLHPTPLLFLSHLRQQCSF